ncbi:MAG: imidazole glycerol phosphate synthase subunit HisH [Desulfovibrionaceae bacterium]
MLAILDYKAGNQTSVRRALEHLGIPCTITADPAVVASAVGLIFPGVGAAGQAMEQLRLSGLEEALRRAVQLGQPLLGICLGCQILLDHSEENDTAALGLVRGTCRLFDKSLSDVDARPLRIPHMGWNTLTVRRPSPLLQGIAPQASFYFVHSYYVEVPEDLCIATAHYGQDFCAVYGRDKLWAVQFHPEKSGQPGLQLLKNYYAYCQGGTHAE